MDVVKRICDCVAVISNGELIEQDTVSEVFSHPKTPLAQQFIQSTLHLDIPEDYLERLKQTQRLTASRCCAWSSRASPLTHRCCPKPRVALT